MSLAVSVDLMVEVKLAVQAIYLIQVFRGNWSSFISIALQFVLTFYQILNLNLWLITQVIRYIPWNR